MTGISVCILVLVGGGLDVGKGVRIALVTVLLGIGVEVRRTVGASSLAGEHKLQKAPNNSITTNTKQHLPCFDKFE